MLADHAVAAENDVDEAKPGVAEIQVSQSGKLVGLLEHLSRTLKKLETAKPQQQRRRRTDAHEQSRTVPPKHCPYLMYKSNRLCLVTKMLLDKVFFANNKQDSCPNAPPPHTQQNNTVQPIDTADAPVCYYHQTFGGKARTCREPCTFSLN